jgi:pantetheine-phosphate adenylyltransferase
MVRRACAEIPHVSVEGFTGLVTTFCAAHDATAIVKGLRAASDFDYELQMAQMNSSLTGVETVFLPTSPERGFVSSSLVKEVAGFGGDVSPYVPAFVHEELRLRASRPGGAGADGP